MNTTSNDPTSAPATEEKFKSLDENGNLDTTGVPKAALTEQKSPLFETADQLAEASRVLRLYVAAFEAFRSGWDDCDVLCEELKETKGDYGYWEKIDRWMGRTSPAQLRPVADDEDWPPDVTADVERFAEKHAIAKTKVDISLAQTGRGADDVMSDDELHALWERLRADGRAMRDAIADGLRTAGPRANNLAEIVRGRVEKLRVLLPQETTNVAISSDVAGEAKHMQIRSPDPLDDQSTTRKNLATAGAADDRTLA